MSGGTRTIEHAASCGSKSQPSRDCQGRHKNALMSSHLPTSFDASGIRMLTPPNDLDHEDLFMLVKRQFEEAGGSLQFSPLGEDSWQYRTGRLWVSVRRDLRGHVPVAYQTALELRRSGLDFVLAPLTGRDGNVVHQVGGYPVVVFPYLDVTQLALPAPTEAERARAEVLLERVHRASPATDLPEETYTFPFDDDLSRALIHARHPPDSGPYSRRLSKLLTFHIDHITTLRREAAELSRICRSENGTLVLTHGEPSAPNFLRRDGELLLADWGGAQWGPPERDWYHVARTINGAAGDRCRPEYFKFYQIRWLLSEIAEYASVLFQNHIGSEDDKAMWQRLTCYLPEP